MKEEKIRVLSLFSGYGTDNFALKRLGIEHEVVGYSDIDKYANQCFKQNHGGLELCDITKINISELSEFDLLTAGFPCTDVSVAGKQDLSKGRTILAYYLKDFLTIKQPKYFLFENVKGLMSKKFDSFRNELLKQWEEAGYNVYFKVLNSKDFGIPQSRSRVWFVGFRKDLNIKEYNKNSQLSLANLENAKTPNDTHNIVETDSQFFKWPEPVELKIFIKDILEKEVDKKYYLSEKLQERFRKYLEEKNRIVNLQPRRGKGIGGKGPLSKNDGTAYCVDKTCGQGIVAMRGRNPENPSDRTIGGPTEQRLEFKEDGCSNTITSVQKDNLVCLGSIQQTTIKRIFETPVEINEFLRSNKTKSNNEIAETLNIPITQLEHYFRIDSSRAIPSPEIWSKLKSILNFDSTWDKEVFSIYEKEIEFEQTRRVYDINGCSPTLNTIKEPMVYDRKGFDSRTKGFRESELSPTLSQKMGTGGNNVPMVSNCIKVGGLPTKPEHYYEKKHSNITGQAGQLRRLTPTECFRLQGFLNDEINLDGLSDTQRYKLAGNGQDVNMVTLIFKEMFR